MLKDPNPNQIKLDYQMFFGADLTPKNYWMKLSHLIPWHDFKKNILQSNGR